MIGREKMNEERRTTGRQKKMERKRGSKCRQERKIIECK
jgi:hypothetical protein